MKSKILLSLGAAAMLSGCVAPGGTYIEKQMNVYSGRAISLLPLEMTPEQVLDYERLKSEEIERNRAILNGRVNNVRGW